MNVIVINSSKTKSALKRLNVYIGAVHSDDLKESDLLECDAVQSG
jgi:ribosomal protein L13